MYSLNAPVPGAAVTYRHELEELLGRFDSVRDPLTLVIKRFGDRDTSALPALKQAVGENLQQWGPIEAAITGIDVFVDPPGGLGPVVYLAVQSPGLKTLHGHLNDQFGTVDPSIEGDHYVPHITLARGGDRIDIEAVTEVEMPREEWSIEELMLWSSRDEAPVKRYSLPYRP